MILHEGFLFHRVIIFLLLYCHRSVSCYDLETLVAQPFHCYPFYFHISKCNTISHLRSWWAWLTFIHLKPIRTSSFLEFGDRRLISRNMYATYLTLCAALKLTHQCDVLHRYWLIKRMTHRYSRIYRVVGKDFTSKVLKTFWFDYQQTFTIFLDFISKVGTC